MEGENATGVTTVTLYVREGLPTPASERAAAVSGRLGELASAGAVEETSERSWPKRVPLADEESAVRDVYHDFVAWAAAEGVDLAPFFHTRECYEPGTTDARDCLVVPALTLAVRRDGELTRVYPHCEDDEVQTVEDGIDALAAALTDADGALTVPAE